MKSKIIFIVLGVFLICCCSIFGLGFITFRSSWLKSKAIQQTPAIRSSRTPYPKLSEYDLPSATPAIADSTAIPKPSQPASGGAENNQSDNFFSLDSANTIFPDDILQEVLFMPGGGDEPMPPFPEPAFMHLPEKERKMYLAGFRPNEHIRVFAYKHLDGHDMPYTVTLIGWKEYIMDAKGALVIDLPKIRYYYIVVGEYSGLVQPQRPLMLESPLKQD